MPDFDPDAYLAAKPAATTPPAFDPDAYLAGPRKGYLANVGEVGGSALETINRTLNPFSQSFRQERERQIREGQTVSETLGVPTMRGLGAVAELAASPFTGAYKTAAPYVSDLEAKAIRAIGEGVVNPIGERAVSGWQSQHPSETQISRDIEPQVETALGVMGARIGMPTAGPIMRPTVPPPPPPPPRPPTSTGPFGVTLSEGQATGDLTTIQREQAALRGTSGEPAARVAGEFAAQQQAQLAAARRDIAKTLDTLGGQIIAEGPTEAGEIVSTGVRGAAKTAKTGVDTAYKIARGLPGEIHAGVFEGIGQGIKGDLSLRAEPVIIDEKLTPFASRMIDDLENSITRLKIQNRADPFGQPNPENIVGVNLAGVDQWRKRLSTFRGDALSSGNAADSRAARAVLESFDTRIDDAINKGLFTGDSRAVNAWNAARAAHADYKTTFGKGKNDPIGGVVNKILGDRLNPPKTGNDVADFLYGSTGVNPSSLNVNVANRVKSILGEQSSEWAAARQGLFSRLTETPPGVKDWGPGKVADRLNRFLNGDGKELAGVVFSQQERTMLQRYADLMRQLEVPQAGANWSNTATFLQKIGNKIGSNVAGALGSIAGHFVGVPYVGELAGYGLGNAAARVAAKMGEAKEARAISGLMPTVAYQIKQWQQAVRKAQSNATPSTRAAVTLAGANLARSLKQMGITAVEAPAAGHGEENQPQVPGPPAQQKHGGGVGDEQGRAQGGHGATLRAHGGRVNGQNIDRNPSDAQKKAGNYAKDHVRIHGLDITIENAKGHKRTGIDKGGKPWSVSMPCHYGYFKRTEGKDGDHVDVYLGPHLKSPKVFVIDQKNADTGRFDEHKTFFGFASQQQVRACYAKAFSDGKAHRRLGHIEEMTVDAFKHWLENGDTTKPIKNGENKKLPHATVVYIAHSRISGKHCGACSMFIKDGPHCTLVADPIAAGGYCRRFRSASMEQEHAA
jgi:hypothetical protein